MYGSGKGRKQERMEQASDSPALPRSHVLSYVAAADSPTRVRQLAARAVLVLAVVHWIAAVVFLVILALDVLRIFTGYSSLPLPFRPPVSEMVREALEQSTASIVFVVFFVTFGVVYFACARPIRRGRKAACRLAILAVVPLILACLMAAVGFIGLPIFALLERDMPPLLLLLLVPGAIFVLIVMLLGDLCGFLSWIAKNPITDKPPIPFIPPAGQRRQASFLK
jgi:hypothetical protein